MKDEHVRPRKKRTFVSIIISIVSKQIFFLFFWTFALLPVLEAASKDWSPADIVSQSSASGFTFSPDGTMIAWVKSRNSTEKDRNITDLYLTRLDRKKKEPGSGMGYATEATHEKIPWVTVRLTRSEESDHTPFFSKNGKILYFLSSRDEGKKLWALNLYGGEPYAVHEFDESIRNLQPLKDGNFIYLSEEGDLLIEAERKEKKDNTQVIEDTLTFKPVRLFLFDVASNKVQRLTDNIYPVNGYAVSDDGRWAVTSHIRSPHYEADAQPTPVCYFWDLKTGKNLRILEGLQTPSQFAFTESHQGFYFTAVTSSDPEWSGAGIHELYYVSIPPEFDVSAYADDKEKKDRLKGRFPETFHKKDEAKKEALGNGERAHPLKPVKVPLDWDWGLATGFEVKGNDVIVSLAKGPLREWALYEYQGAERWRKRNIDLGKHAGRVMLSTLSEDHQKVVYIYSTASTPPQYRLGELEIGRRSIRITEGEEFIRLNASLADKYRASSEIFHWAGAEDRQVNGILYYPEEYEPGRRYPLVVAIRGGPAAVTSDAWNMSWAYYPHIFSRKGAFVLMPNYHGSSNHGLEFVESIKKRYYELELQDIVKGIETLYESGKIDKDSLGVMGWSNGSILSIALSVEYPDMFKAIGAGAGNVNWISDYGTCRFGVRFDQSYIGGAPWDSTDGTFYNRAYIEKSPLFRMDQVKAPTIIFFGSEDRAVPRDQGWEHYRALQQIGKAPVRFLWFPGQPHGLQKLTHQKRKIEEEIAWFDRYLFGTFETPDPAFKEGSPLAGLLKRDSIARFQGYYGEEHKGFLIPEVLPVGKDTIAIGRFTVTNQQYRAYDTTHTFHPLQANHPVRSLKREDAISYTTWLSELTGEAFRLPNHEEAAVLHRIAHRSGTGQNNLNYLAGYDITLDEALLLRGHASLPDADRLIQTVGLRSPVKVGNAGIYDLGGNVAEWYDNEKNHNPSIYGYGAIDFIDPRDDSRPVINPGFTGFRVIRE